MIDIPLALFLALLALMLGLAVLLDCRRRAARGRREGNLREAMRETIGEPPKDRSST